MIAIEKIRNIVAWANYQNEGFNLLFKSIEQIEKAYDFCIENGFEFLDSEYISSLDKNDQTKCIEFREANDLKL
jgi:viroplasmin and RNaseH domain-containing protein